MTLGGELPDRVPVAPLVQEAFLSYIYPHKKHIDRVYDGARRAREFGFELMARPKKCERPDFLKRSYHSWEVSVKQATKDVKFYKTTTIKAPGQTLRGNW